MEAVNKKLSKKVKAKFKGSDTFKRYKYGEVYLLDVEQDGEGLSADLATGGAKRTYKNIEEYKKDWEELEVQAEKKANYYFMLTYNEDGSPNLDHKNSGIRETDVIACLEIAKSHLIEEITGGNKK